MMGPGGSGALGGPAADGTVVRDATWIRVLMWAGFPLLGAGAGWLLTLLADWVAGLAWAPLQGPFKLVASIPEPGATIGALGVGALAGLVFAFIGEQESLTVTVSDEHVGLRRGDTTREFARGAVHGVCHEGKELILFGAATRELARESSDLAGDRLAAAFTAHGYPWITGGDPYRDRFRRWVEDLPDLPPAANALLKARAKALTKGDAADLRDLRGELATLGVVVRDEKKRQYWRTTGNPVVH